MRVPLREVPAVLVSIRSPRRSEGRCGRNAVREFGYSFQSAPPAEVRGDACNRVNRLDVLGFNPLPPPK